MIYPADPEYIARAAALVRNGSVVGFPTETVYGLGADARNESAVRRVFELKGRPATNPLIVHVRSREQAEQVADIRSDARVLRRFDALAVFWPGPLSLVVPKRPGISDLVSAGLPTVALRIPRHEVAQALLRESGMAIAAPSANLYSTVSPTSAAHVHEAFGEKLEMILDGGACQVGLESTVVAISGESVELLRPGAVTLEQLRAALGAIDPVHVRTVFASKDTPQSSPGLMKVHYAPRTPLAFRSEVEMCALPARTGLIAFRKPEPAAHAAFSEVLVLSPSGNQQEIAKRLFAALRELDRKELELIVIDSCPEEGLGLAIMDRLRRATAAHHTAGKR